MAQVWRQIRHPVLVGKCIFSFSTAGLNYFPQVIQLISWRARKRVELSRLSFHIWSRQTQLLFPQTPSSFKRNLLQINEVLSSFTGEFARPSYCLCDLKLEVALVWRNAIDCFPLYPSLKNFKYLPNYFDFLPPPPARPPDSSYYSEELKKTSYRSEKAVCAELNCCMANCVIYWSFH